MSVHTKMPIYRLWGGGDGGSEEELTLYTIMNNNPYAKIDHTNTFAKILATKLF